MKYFFSPAILNSASGLTSLVPHGLEVHFDEVIGQNSPDIDTQVKETIDKLTNQLPFDEYVVIAGAETGVGMADRLSDALGVRTNGAESTEPRRNKYMQGEKVSSTNVDKQNRRQPLLVLLVLLTLSCRSHSPSRNTHLHASQSGAKRRCSGGAAAGVHVVGAGRGVPRGEQP